VRSSNERRLTDGAAVAAMSSVALRRSHAAAFARQGPEVRSAVRAPDDPGPRSTAERAPHCGVEPPARVVEVETGGVEVTPVLDAEPREHAFVLGMGGIS
jgi:hypothetical protein